MRHPMRRGRWSLLLIVPASTAPVFGVGGVTNASSEGEPVVVGDLAYFTGDFSEVGPSLAAQVDFPIEIINEDPPLGRPWEVIHEDIGTVGEGQAARKLLEADGVDILVSPAHEYFTYRDFALDWVASNEGPIMPTVHGGVIPGNVGGTPEEPIFRAQGLDEGQGVTTVLYAQQLGAESIVVMTTPAAGYQLSADAIENTAAELGIEVLDRIDVPGDQPSYRAEIQRALDAGADAIIVQAQPVESGTMVRQAAEAGTSTVFIGEATWVEQEFVDAAGTEAFAFHEVVAFPGFGKQENAAWKLFQPAVGRQPRILAVQRRRRLLRLHDLRPPHDHRTRRRARWRRGGQLVGTGNVRGHRCPRHPVLHIRRVRGVDPRRRRHRLRGHHRPRDIHRRRRQRGDARGPCLRR